MQLYFPSNPYVVSLFILFSKKAWKKKISPEKISFTFAILIVLISYTRLQSKRSEMGPGLVHKKVFPLENGQRRKKIHYIAYYHNDYDHFMTKQKWSDQVIVITITHMREGDRLTWGHSFISSASKSRTIWKREHEKTHTLHLSQLISSIFILSHRKILIQWKLFFKLGQKSSFLQFARQWIN